MNINFTDILMSFIIPVALAVVTALVTTNIEFNKMRKKSVFEIKIKALNEALKIIDIYASWMIKSERKNIARDKINGEELTFMARKCYNELTTTCGKEIVELFNKILFSEKIKWEYVNSFRNAVRKELGLEVIDLDKENSFIVWVGSNEQSKYFKRKINKGM